ncbi:hypothetical protein [Burkholderia gladioli]|nr:hypothetical protein [Burkholderia gladioli]
MSKRLDATHKGRTEEGKSSEDYRRRQWAAQAMTGNGTETARCGRNERPR